VAVKKYHLIKNKEQTAGLSSFLFSIATSNENYLTLTSNYYVYFKISCRHFSRLKNVTIHSLAAVILPLF